MNRRLLAALAGSAVIAATLAPMTAVATGPGTRTERVKIDKIDPSFRPYLADANRQITVVLELAADPALTVDGLSRAQQKTRAGALRTTQQGLDGKIKAAGGKVTGRYQYAYNGIRVRAKGTKLAALAAIPGVTAIRPLRTYTIDNANAVSYVGAPTAWQANGATGDGVTIAVIDSGIDYTHADFGGPGTAAAYDANNAAVIEPGSFPTSKVIAGYDFAGNDYDAGGETGSLTPTPDADPLDCGNHGTHVSGTAAGQGVKVDHSTYTGPYTASLDAAGFAVAPGVAPEAKLVALKVFGCEGSTNLVVDALEWVAAYNVSHADGIDVVNMSLGAPFGSNTDPDAVATNNLVDQGVVVVASAGNESSVPYITGAPAAATKAISVAALDAFPAIPMATVDLPGTANDVSGNNQNAFPGLPVSGQLHVVAGTSAGLSLGCTPADYDAGSAGKIVVIRRGVCVFVDKGAAAQAAGAIGVIVVNRTDTADGDLPTFLGYNPESFSIPMVGVTKGDVTKLQAGDGQAVTIKANGTSPNPTYRQVADFSSSGPRWGDSWLKPDVAAPGVNLLSSLNGSGWNGTTYSGTSMASPVTAGVAALVKDVHPGWSPLRVKAAIANTADASAAKIADYDPLRAGAGVVMADRAVSTTVLATTSDGTTSLNFGYEQADGSYGESKWITLSNTGNRSMRYALSASSDLVSISPSSVRVGARDSVRVLVRASLSRSEVAALPSADQFVTGDFGVLTSLAGVITASPTSTVAGAYALRVPYLLVPRGLSDVDAELHGPVTTTAGTTSTTLRVRNNGVHAGYADTYALGVLDVRGDGDHGTDVRAVGVQTMPGDVFGSTADDRSLQFAVNMYDRFSTAAPHEVDVAVDTNDDGEADYYVIGIDNGLISGGAYDGLYISVIFDATTFDIVDGWIADAPLNGSTLILPALASDLGLAEGDGSFTYWVAAFDGFTGGADETAIAPAFDAYAPAQSTGDFVPVPARGRVSVPAWVTTSATGVKGWMVVSLDDRNGASQADIVRLRSRD